MLRFCITKSTVIIVLTASIKLPVYVIGPDDQVTSAVLDLIQRALSSTCIVEKGTTSGNVAFILGSCLSLSAGCESLSAGCEILILVVLQKYLVLASFSLFACFMEVADDCFESAAGKTHLFRFSFLYEFSMVDTLRQDFSKAMALLEHLINKF